MTDERALGTETPLELARDQLFQALVLLVLLGWAVCCCSVYDQVSCKPENRPGLLPACPLHAQCWDGGCTTTPTYFPSLSCLLLSLFDILSWGLRDYPSIPGCPPAPPPEHWDHREPVRFAVIFGTWMWWSLTKREKLGLM